MRNEGIVVGRIAALGVSLAFLCGCSPGLADNEASRTARVTTDVNAVSASGGAVSEDEFDYEEYLADLRQMIRIDDPPETEIVRIIAPDERAQVWEECMTEAGWAVSTTFDGGLTPPNNMPEDQWPAYDVSDYVCLAQFPVDDSLIDHFGTEQIDIIYAYYVDDLTPCLQVRGFEMTEPPSLETFRASWVRYATGAYHASETTWFPYADIDAGALSAADWENLNAACPQSPPREVLFPSD